MPTYDYHCSHCKKNYEIFHSIHDAPKTECAVCLQPTLSRMLSAPTGIIFKGSGFYETDYKRSLSTSEASKNTCGAGGCGSCSTAT